MTDSKVIEKVIIGAPTPNRGLDLLHGLIFVGVFMSSSFLVSYLFGVKTMRIGVSLCSAIGAAYAVLFFNRKQKSSVAFSPAAFTGPLAFGRGDDIVSIELDQPYQLKRSWMDRWFPFAELTVVQGKKKVRLARGQFSPAQIEAVYDRLVAGSSD